MKRTLVVWLMLFALTIPNIKAQSIVAYRYWFDNAFSATTHPVSNPQTDLDFNNSFSTEGVSIGFHILNIQFLDNSNHWSAVLGEQFYRAKTGIDISGYEYWFDEDYVNAVNQDVDLSSDLDLNVPINATTLPMGFHKFNIRFKTKGGDWSVVTTEQFYKVKTDIEIEAYQYWFDGDFSNAILQNVTATNDLDLNVPISTTALSEGIHVLNMRFKTKGGDWSVPISSEFYRAKTGTAITGYQYWFDDNFSSRTTKSVASTSDLNLDVNINTQVLEQGYHRFNIRFKTQNNDWSVPTTDDFYKLNVGNNKIVAYRYWFNNNIQDEITVNLTTPVTDYSLNASIDTKFAPSGANVIHFQFKTEGGDWSVPTSDDYNSNVAKVAGVTVIVHGFSLFGNFNNDFKELARAIRTRAGGGSIFKNNPQTGQWEALDNSNSNSSSDEIILLYDWAVLSSENISGITGFDGNGYLESAADNLFALLNSSPFPLVNNQKLLNRPIHFIGHSRGNILILQTLHRVRKYFPDVNIEQVTLLDSHPATLFGDIKGKYSVNNVFSLPCVNGIADNCNFYCSLDNNISLKMPENVKTFDNYYRKDGSYEEVISSNYSLASFDGVSVPSAGNYNRQLKNSLFALDCIDKAGGAHSAVHSWYYGTVATNNTVSYGGCDIDNFSTEVLAQWYNPNLAFEDPRVAEASENRNTLGFNRSRIGGKGYPVNSDIRTSLNEMEKALEARTGFGLRPVFNGDFLYGDGKAGWTLNGGIISELIIDDPSAKNRKLKLNTSELVKHSFFYFTSNPDNNFAPYSHLRFKASVPISNDKVRNIKVSFSDLDYNRVVFERSFTLDYVDQYYYCPIPEEMRNKVATFSIGILSGGEAYFDDFEFWTGNPPPSYNFSPSALLPVELSQFKGDCQNDKINLAWQTASERNSDHFEIQYSMSPQTGWKSVATVVGKGNSNVLNNYSTTYQSASRISYYRLKQVDKDSSVHYSSTIAIECQSKKHYLKVYPNPATEIVLIETDVTEGLLNVEMYNVYGQQVMKKIHNSGIYPIEISLSDKYRAGTYIVKVFKGNGDLLGIERLVVH